MQGTLDRNNPLRRELAQPFRGAELFVRFQLRYDPPEDEGEFFVMWLDRLDGGDRAVHSENVPNIGVHVADTGPKKGKTVFIVRIGGAKTAWSTVEMLRGRTYEVVDRLSKSEATERADFDRFDLWVDPKAADLDKPDASIKNPQDVNFVRWIGFGTGRKTEREDRIHVDDLVLSRTWQDVLKHGESTPLAQTAPKPPPSPNSTSDHWAFQPVKRPALPKVKREKWIRTPVDIFIAAKQESKGLRPAAEATPRTLVRRLYLDLLGLPPTPAEIEAFVSDKSPDAYKNLVNKLLDSPHYGERWARYWLDLARWGESHGNQHDIPRPYAWRYRDYVIDSFNSDKPYGQFITEQLAGDELKPYSDENLIATCELDRTRHNPSVTPEREEQALRRTLYLYQRRSEMPAVMQMFDAPELIASCPQRGVSTVALQPLYLLNSDFMMHRAEALADKVYLHAGEDAARQVETAFQRTLGRTPAADEKKQSIAMLATYGDKRDALIQFCHALLNLNEFVYIP